MRIIGGEARGRTLYAPTGLDTRPTSDRVRESLFNILGARVIDARVLDLFAGSGALALEAISRGAERAVLVDRDRKAAFAIERNIRAVNAQNPARLLRCDWRAAVARLAGECFTLVFLDPPYRMEGLCAQAAISLHEAGLVETGCILAMEHHREVDIDLPLPFEIFDRRQYSDAALSFARVTAEI